jgi:hypothetical protein
VERHRAVTIISGFAVMAIPAAGLLLVPPMGFVLMSSVIALLLFPMVLAAVAGRVVFERIAKPG